MPAIRIVAAVKRFRLSFRSTGWSIFSPLTAMKPYSVMQTPPITQVGIVLRKVTNGAKKLATMARIAVATTTLVVGAVAGGLGGFSFYIMNGAKKDRDKYLNYYNYSETQADMDLYRKKTNDADKKRKKYLILGGVGAGVGAALIATGITLYCIEFKGEKEVKKKYNVSFGASPFDGTLQFALNW